MALTIIRSVIITLMCVAGGMNMIHQLQENRYQAQVMTGRLKGKDGQVWRQLLIATCACLADWLLPTFLAGFIKVEETRTSVSFWSVLVIFVVAAGIEWYIARDTDTETELAITQRFARLTGMDALLLGIICAVVQLLTIPPYILYAASVYFAFIAALIMKPIEDLICSRYYKMARKKIAAHKKLITIGIVGSYGKTEVKMILDTLLSTKYNVLTTRPNFSAAMGIARTVLDELNDKHQVFIAEMGAVQKGEITEMTRMIRPRYGVLTCISVNKKGAFKSAEAAAQSANELLARIPRNGMCVFGSDGGYSDRLYAIYKGNKRNAGALSGRNCYMQARHIETSISGTRFELVCEDGSHCWAETALLGMYSIRNIAIAATIARELGLTMEEIASGIKRLKCVKHHLQLKTGAVNVIDDSRNTNPESAAESLKVLAGFPGRRVLVTGGFSSADDNGYNFGTCIPDCADHVVLIGHLYTRGIAEALVDSGFPKASIRKADTQKEAIRLIRSIITKGDTILYEGVYPTEDEDD